MNDLDHFHAVILTDGAYLVDLPFASSLEPYTVFLSRTVCKSG